MGFVLLCETVGIAGSVFTAASIPVWFATLSKPSFNPPNWVFGPVWTLLYALMGVAVFLVWEKRKENKKAKLSIWFFVAQLFVNGIWTPIFFGLHEIGLAMIIIALLWFLILVTIALFWRINKVASWLLFPYLVWVSFAWLLNYSYWILN